MDIPGYVDIQVNGYKGVDFSSSDLTEERFLYASREIIKSGTIVFLPTVITSSTEIYERNLQMISKAIQRDDLKDHIPGIHLEGPFISDVDGARGAHNSEWIKQPDLVFFDQLVEWSDGKVKLITIAAELEKSDVLCRHAVDKGIAVSLGHQMASGTDLQRLSDSGASLLTHLGNGIPQMIDRHNNPIWAGLANDHLTAMIITDGHHLPPSLIKTILKVKGASNTIIVSDASPIAGLSPGNYSTLGNDVILEESGRLFNPETGYLVGSSSTMMECINYLRSLDFIDEEDLSAVGFYNSLEILDIHPQSIIDRFG
ncbi:MAG: N-acetylglucosamine-6-phosphate deacetylase [Bacteroidetes bacterium]|jgi:N-acetylglucosamine-6-phosphate deacetylase|nr:N-acetylglucosamine-6-phosphate deacetylase [Bacteroidota bacterium]